MRNRIGLIMSAFAVLTAGAIMGGDCDFDLEDIDIGALGGFGDSDDDDGFGIDIDDDGFDIDDKGLSGAILIPADAALWRA